MTDHSAEAQEITIKLANVINPHGVVPTLAALVTVTKVILRAWPKESRLEMLADVVKSLKTAVLRHNV